MFLLNKCRRQNLLLEVRSFEERYDCSSIANMNSVLKGSEDVTPQDNVVA